MNYTGNDTVAMTLPAANDRHLLTVVVEDYCHPAGFRQTLDSGHWHRFESRVQQNVDLTLDLLDEAGARATFFILGWVAEHEPEVVRKIVERGHEIASKGHFHRSIREMSRTQFAEDVVRAKETLEKAGGVEVRGYRIPYSWFSIKDLWGLEALAKAGYAYDSSLRPLGWMSGSDDSQRFVKAHLIGGKPFWEIPLSAIKIGGFNIPVSGGNFMRQLPDSFIRWSWEHWSRHIASPLVFYFHIWEIDPEQPRINGVPMLQRIRQYRNLDAMYKRVQYYLTNYKYSPIADALGLPPAMSLECSPPTKRENNAPMQEIGTAAVRSPNSRIKVSVVIPCYNEEATIGYLSNTLRAFADYVRDELEVTYVLVDDGSSDKTWQRINEVFGQRADCIVVQHQKNRGVAAATMTGIRHSPTDIVCAIDCDGTYDPRQLRHMIQLLSPDVDMVTASPYHRDGVVVNLPAWRLVLSRGLSLLYHRVLNNKIATYTSCFRVYRQRAIYDVTLKYEGFVGITEILIHVDLQGGRIAEYPAIMEVRLLGSSKMKIIRTILGHLKLLAHLSIDQISNIVRPNNSPRPGVRP